MIRFFLSLGLIVSCTLRWSDGAASARPHPRGAGLHDSLGKVPTLLVPAHPDTGPPESPPAPLLIPGRPTAPDTSAKARAKRAREQFQLARAMEGPNPGGAIAAYRNALIFDPTIPEASYRIGMLFLTRNQVKEAARNFTNELRRHPAHVDARRQLGLALARLNRKDRAIRLLDRLTHDHPEDDENWRALSFAYSAAGRPRDAENALRRAIKIGPRRAAEHRDLGVLLASRGRTREAHDEYRKALEIDANDPSVWLDLANLDKRAGKLEQALASFRQAEARDSGFALAIQGEIDVLTALKRQAEAGETYRRWLRLRPDDHNARLEAVRLYDALGRGDIALEIAREGVRQNPQVGEAHMILAMALDSNDESRAALGEMRKAEALFRPGSGREQARQLISVMRSRAPDSLRGLFVADSIAHAGRADSTRQSKAPNR